MQLELIYLQYSRSKLDEVATVVLYLMKAVLVLMAVVA